MSGPVPPTAGAPPARPAAEMLRITLSMTVACAIGALVLGAIYLGTDRYARAVRAAGERKAVTQLLSLGPDARVREISQYLDRARARVVYRQAGEGGAAATRLVYALDGTLVARAQVPAATEEPRAFESLGRIFVASRGGQPAGFVIEGQTSGYKNTIRFFVALDSSFAIAGVRVVEHDEDPGLGAETATPWFGGQFVGRSAAQVAALDVTRDPLPEDWRAALARLDREPLGQWRKAHAALIAREGGRPIHAVTGATISSRALTDGVRGTVDHFRRRWALIAPQLGAPS
ncbi:MAG TPA: FMN-binding protein [Candidatus Eisenbacteria bacterium]